MAEPKLVVLPRPVRVGDDVRRIGGANMIRKIIEMSEEDGKHFYANNYKIFHSPKQWYVTVPSDIEYPSNVSRKTNKPIRVYGYYAPIVEFSKLTEEQKAMRKEIKRLKYRITISNIETFDLDNKLRDLTNRYLASFEEN